MTNEHLVDQVFNDIASIKETKDKFVDGIELHVALMLKMIVGLKKKEIARAKLSDLMYKNGIPVGINMDREIQFPKDFSIEIDKYLKLRNSKSEDKLSDSPLFPKYYGNNEIRNLDRHLEKCFKEMGKGDDGWNLHYLKEIGIFNHYNNCMDRGGLTEEDCINKTADYFNIKSRTVKENLENRKSVKPNAMDEYFNHSEKHAEYNFSNTSDVVEYEKIGLELIEKTNKIKKADKEKIKNFFLQEIEKYKDA